MKGRIWMYLGYLALVPACGSNEPSLFDPADAAGAAGDGRGAAKDYATDKMGAGGESGIFVHQDANLLDATPDASIVDAPGTDSFVMDAAECRADVFEHQDANLLDATPDASIADAPKTDSFVTDAAECRADISELSTQGWDRPCATLVDAGVPSPTCIDQTPGLHLFRTTCDQREIWLWQYGTHSQECFYDHGALVGARLQNDTPAFCGNTSNVLLIGATDGCPATPATLVLDCTPFVDSDWHPRGSDAR